MCVVKFIELKRGNGDRFLFDIASGWEISDKQSAPALWSNHGQGRTLDCGERYEEIRSKPPGPMVWASKTRQQLNVTWEPILVMCKTPRLWLADNRRVLQPHSVRHQALIAAGGERREASYSDGKYKIKAGKFGAPTAGRIPRNILEFSHNCPGQRRYKQQAAALGLPMHGAPWPESLVKFMVQYLTAEGMLVADICAGSQTTPAVCEQLGRRWLSTDVMAEYVRGGATRFPSAWVNPELDEILGVGANTVNARCSQISPAHS